jgi:hypothetical protein
VFWFLKNLTEQSLFIHGIIFNSQISLIFFQEFGSRFLWKSGESFFVVLST